MILDSDDEVEYKLSHAHPCLHNSTLYCNSAPCVSRTDKASYLPIVRTLQVCMPRVIYRGAAFQASNRFHLAFIIWGIHL